MRIEYEKLIKERVLLDNLKSENESMNRIRCRWKKRENEKLLKISIFDIQNSKAKYKQ